MGAVENGGKHNFSKKIFSFFVTFLTQIYLKKAQNYSVDLTLYTDPIFTSNCV